MNMSVNECMGLYHTCNHEQLSCAAAVYEYVYTVQVIYIYVPAYFKYSCMCFLLVCINLYMVTVHALHDTSCLCTISLAI